MIVFLKREQKRFRPMKTGFSTVFAAVLVLMMGPPAMAKGLFIEIVPIPNSDLTDVFGINDNANINNDVITGSWFDSHAIEHGYVGPVSGVGYKTFDDPNSPNPGTEPRAINDNGYITGFSNSQSGQAASYIPFERDPKGTITEVTMKGALLNDIAQGINNKNNEFAAAYLNTSLAYVGYLGENGAYKKSINLSGIANTGFAGRGINNSGDIVGWYYDTTGVQHGFLISHGTATTIDPNESDLASNVLEGINDKGMITGQWTDTSGLVHSYTYNLHRQKFTRIKVPGSTTFVQAWGINDQGLVALGSDAGYYIWCPTETTCPEGARTFYKPRIKPRPQLP